MDWVPLFEVSSLDLEADAKLLRSILGGLESKVGAKDGFKFDADAQLAMGWWFYTIHVRIEFIKDLVKYEHSLDPRIRDEKGILDMVGSELVRQHSKARVKLHGDRSIFARYWTWLMK